ncbi:MAG: hypothetical protein QM503_10600 [Bacteroidota bacterium]
MNYTILETHCVFENDKLKEVAVLWDDHGNVRATYSTLNPRAGYENLTSNDTITPELFQKVADGGSYVDEDRRSKYFPGERNWSR